MSTLYAPYLPIIRRQFRNGLLLLGIFIAAMVLICVTITVCTTLLGGWLTAVIAVSLFTLISSYAFLQRYLLPLQKTWRLLEDLERREPSSFTGTYQGAKTAKGITDGVQTQKLSIDAGDRVRSESVCREVSLPAIFFPVDLQTGQSLHWETKGSILVQTTPGLTLHITPAKAAYRISTVVCIALAAISVIFWWSVHTMLHRVAADSILEVAVCTEAHSTHAQERIIQTITIPGISRLSINYSNTLNSETTALFLGTYGSLEADILFLPANYFSDIFDNEGEPLNTAQLEEGLGFIPRYIVDSADNTTGVILYIPGEDAYNSHFSSLVDWVAIPRDCIYAVAIRPGSEQSQLGNAHLALTQLLVCLAGEIVQ